MTQTREIPFPKGCGADDVVIMQEMQNGYWIDTGIRKLSDTTKPEEDEDPFLV